MATTQSDAAALPAAPVRVQRAGHCLLAYVSGDYPDRIRPESFVPREQGVLPLLIEPSALDRCRALEPDFVEQLRVERPLPPAGGALRVLSGITSSPEDGPRFGAELSVCLDTDVIVADGMLSFPRAGQLFSVGGGWQTFRAGHQVERSGPRVPAPQWQAALPVDVTGSTGASDGSVTAVPAGLWLRTLGARPNTPSRRVFELPVSDRNICIVIGAPDEAMPAAARIVEVLAALPVSRQRQVLLVPGDSWPDGEDLPQEVVDRWGQDVHVAHVMPHRTADGKTVFAVFGSSGEVSWKPWVTVSRYRPGDTPVPVSWSAPLVELAPTSEAAWALGEGWALQLTAAGMAVRPQRSPWPGARPLARRGPEILLIGGELPRDVFATVATLLRRLDAPERGSLRIVAAEPAAEQSAIMLARELDLRPVRGDDAAGQSGRSAAGVAQMSSEPSARRVSGDVPDHPAAFGPARSVDRAQPLVLGSARSGADPGS